jgi:hypothetical protein
MYIEPAGPDRDRDRRYDGWMDSWRFFPLRIFPLRIFPLRIFPKYGGGIQGFFAMGGFSFGGEKFETLDLLLILWMMGGEIQSLFLFIPGFS